MKRIKRPLGILLSLLLIVCLLAGCGTASVAGRGSAVEGSAAGTGSSAKVPETLVFFDAEKASDAGEKDESVMVSADASGNPKEVTVAATLRDTGSEDFVKDKSDLTDIINLEGYEMYDQNGSDLLWQNYGEAITYEGKSDKTPNVGVKVTYYLDGKVVKPEELAGKSGEVKLHFDYINNEPEDQKLPYLYLTTVILDRTRFSDIRVTNGSETPMDDTALVVGYAVPGLKKILGLSGAVAQAVNVPEYVEISAKAKDFNLDFTTTIVSSGLMKDVDTDQLKDVGDLTANLNHMRDASAQIMDGIVKLSQGSDQFDGALKQYTDGAAKLNQGVGALSDGIQFLNESGAALPQGAEEIASGLALLETYLYSVDTDELREIGEKLDEAAEELIPLIGQLLAVLPQLEELKTSLEELADLLGNTTGNLETIKGELELLQTEIETLRDQGVDTEPLETILQQVFGSLQETIDNLSSYTLPEVPDVDYKKLIEYADEFLEFLDEIQTILGPCEEYPSFSEIVERIIELRDSVAALSEGAGMLSAGVDLYTYGVAQLADGAVLLKDGSGQLGSKGGQLYLGFGVLSDGIRKLQSGYQAFDEAAIQKITSLADIDLNKIFEQLKKVKAMDGESRNYSGITEGTKGSVQYVIETAGITK